jgi:hypothetical protein
MRRCILFPIAGLVLITACNNAKKPNDANFAAAINQYLTKHGEVCTVINRQFPVDVPRSEQSDPYSIGVKLEALTHSGLVNVKDTTAVLHGMLAPFQGPTPPQPVRHYELTSEGKKYLRQIPGDFGPTNALCYGQKAVDSIVKWTEPVTSGAYSQSEVTYTYKVVSIAPWTERPDVQRVFPDIKVTMADASKKNQVAGAQLTNKGWWIPGT